MNDPTVAPTTVVITGATAGLGRAVAMRVAALGHTVVVPARDSARGTATVRALGAGAVTLPLDLADLGSVRAFPALLAAAGLPPLGAIVANAGAQFTDRTHVSADGYEATFATNHLGHFALLLGLLPALTADGRIVIVGSGTHKAQRVRNFGFPPPRWDCPEALAKPGAGSGQVAYATSKLANVATALELRRRLPVLRPDAHIAVHTFDPGLMSDTDLSRDYPAPVRRAYVAATPLISRLIPGATTAAASAAELARLAFDPTHPGRDIELTRDGRPSAQAQDPELGRELWEGSVALVSAARRGSPAPPARTAPAR
ncbi:MAG: SDR family NAD(P)-dependent oxidoreductase [Solirubrobacteraceae bacterium]|nr:SDR family NAD(P)-dependent oxidoreductase [Solirubrobacteraceae bacterium]